MNRTEFTNDNDKQVTMITRLAAILILLSLITTGCALGSAAKIKELSQGMSSSEIKTLLGDPIETKVVHGDEVWKYSLHEPWTGWIPHYLVLDDESNTLMTWYADWDEFRRTQQELQAQLLMFQAFTSTLNAGNGQSQGHQSLSERRLLFSEHDWLR